LETIEGRRLLHEFYRERRVKNALEFKTLLECWKLCRDAISLQMHDGRRIRFENNLGRRLGTRVFFEEIVGTYYYNSVLGLVYFGAMLVLVGVGLYLAGFDLLFALGTLLVEALFLLLLAVVTSYSRNDEAGKGTATAGAPEPLMASMNNSVREMTTAVSDLFRLLSQTDIRQDALLTRLTDGFAKVSAENARKYMERIDQTNAILREHTEQSREQLQSLIQQQHLALEQTRLMLAMLERDMREGAHE